MSDKIIPDIAPVVWWISYQEKDGTPRCHAAIGPRTRDDVSSYINTTINSVPRLPTMYGATKDCEFEVEAVYSDEELQNRMDNYRKIMKDNEKHYRNKENLWKY